jgi:hypothetical protein
MTTTTTIIRPPARRRWLSVLLGIVIFFAGLAAGVGLAVVFAVGTLQFILHHPENAPTRITTFLTRRLSLDATQRQQVLDIMSRHQSQIQAIRREMRPQFDEQLDQIRTEVGAVLNDEQRIKWQELFDRLRERWTPTLEVPATTSPTTQP